MPRLDRAARQEVVDWYDAASRARLGTTAVTYPIGAIGWGRVDGSNYVEEVVFSADARFLALPYGNPR